MVILPLHKFFPLFKKLTRSPQAIKGVNLQLVFEYHVSPSFRLNVQRSSMYSIRYWMASVDNQRDNDQLFLQIAEF